MTTTRSPMIGDYEVSKRADLSGGNFYVQGSLNVIKNGTETNIETLLQTSYTHTQNESAPVWLVEHNLNTVRPIIRIYDSSGQEVMAKIDYQNATSNSVYIYFAYDMAGSAIAIKPA